MGENAELKRKDETGGVCNCSGFNASVMANGNDPLRMSLLESRGVKRIVPRSISSLLVPWLCSYFLFCFYFH